MITDMQRIEVATRMREILRDDPHGWLDMMVAKAVVDVMGEGMAIGETLADLVDRPTCHDVGGGYEFRCSGCGCVIHIFRDCCFGEDDSAMTVGGDSLYVPHYCPNCGAEVADDE